MFSCKPNFAPSVYEPTIKTSTPLYQNGLIKKAEIKTDIVEINTLTNQLDVTDIYIGYFIQLNTHSSQA